MYFLKDYDGVCYEQEITKSKVDRNKKDTEVHVDGEVEYVQHYPDDPFDGTYYEDGTSDSGRDGTKPRSVPNSPKDQDGQLGDNKNFYILN